MNNSKSKSKRRAYAQGKTQSLLSADIIKILAQTEQVRQKTAELTSSGTKRRPTKPNKPNNPTKTRKKGHRRAPLSSCITISLGGAAAMGFPHGETAEICETDVAGYDKENFHYASPKPQPLARCLRLNNLLGNRRTSSYDGTSAANPYTKPSRILSPCN